jgi:FG-GAP-like repeat/FG-GAP repeat
MYQDKHITPSRLAALLVISFAWISLCSPCLAYAEAPSAYFKKDGNTWYKIQKSPNGQTTVLGEVPSPETKAQNPTAPILNSAPAGTVFAPSAATSTGSWPEAVAIGDLNHDGRNDVVLTTSAYGSNTNDNSILIFFQNANRQLNPPVRYAAGAAAITVAIADMNGDGWNDIVVGKNGSGIRVFLQDANGGFQNFTDYQTANAYKICTGDFNNDGRMDMAGIGFSGSKVDVFTQQTNGTIAFSAQYSASYGGYNDLKAGDVNGDGLTDIVAMSGQGYAYPNISVLLQTNGGFATAAFYDIGGNELTGGIGIGDVNGDGRNDIVTSYGGNRPTSFIAIFRQQPNGLLALNSTNSSYDIPGAMAIADLDLDGKQDIVTLHDGAQQLGLYFQSDSNGILAEQLYSIPYATSYNPHGLAIGDINGDEMPDAVIADYNHGLVILTNRLAPPPFKIQKANISADGKITLSIPYHGGKTNCTIMVTDNPAGTNWTVAGTVTGNTWTDTNSTSQSRRFYRLIAK